MILQLVKEPVCNPGFLEVIGMAGGAFAVAEIYDFVTELKGDQE